MQICALYSQLHRHSDACLHANEAVMLAHWLIKDGEKYCANLVN
jgi:hypothetical protein